MATMDDAFASPAADSAPAQDLRAKATVANNVALIAVVLTVLWYCSGFMTLLFALPMAAFAVHQARQVLAADPDEVTEVYARNAMSMGVICGVFSGLFLTVLAGIVLMYASLIAVAVLGNL